MGCCNILTGYAPPHTPPSLNDFPIYIDRLHKEVWYWSGTSWETIWQVSIATATTAGMVKVSPTSPITIDAEGFLGIDCTRLKAQCHFITQAELDTAITLLRTQFTTEISRIDASITSIKTSIGEILVRLGDIDNRITTLTTTVTDLSRRITIVEGDVTTLKGAVTTITGIATDVTKLKSDVARLDDPMLINILSTHIKLYPTQEYITAAAPHADIIAQICLAQVSNTPSYIKFSTYPLSVQKGVWKQLPNSRESITISFPDYLAGIDDYIFPDWVPQMSIRGRPYPMHHTVSPDHITNVSARLIRGSTPEIDLPPDYEAYLPELCAAAGCAVITDASGGSSLSTTLDVTIVKHTSTPKGNIVVTIELPYIVYHTSYLIPIVP